MSELAKVLPYEKFETAFKSFMKQAEDNAISGKSRGSKAPVGIVAPKASDSSGKLLVDGAHLGVQYGQGAASQSPYFNWGVVSIYYLVSDNRICLGIEEDIYGKVRQLPAKRYAIIGNKKAYVAIFYEVDADSLDFHELYDAFMKLADKVRSL